MSNQSFGGSVAGAALALIHTQRAEGVAIDDVKPLTLNKVGITVVLNRLARNSNVRAKALYAKLMSSWGARPDREWVTVKLGDQDLSLLRTLGLPARTLESSVVQSGYLVTYRHPNNAKMEVVVTSRGKLPKKKTFNIGGKKRRLVAVQVTRINTKEAKRMAAKTKKRKVEEDELDELEGLEDLEDLEDLDDEEPEDEEDLDEEEEDEEPAPKAKRGRTKKAPAKKAPAKSRKRKAEPEDEEEDEDEDEDEEPAPRRKKAAAKKGAAKKNGKGGLPVARELPKGQMGPQQIADMVGGNCDARYVRIWLRESEYEREDGSRWAFSGKEGRTIAKEIKADRKRAGV